MNSVYEESYAGRCARFGSSAREFILKYEDREVVGEMVEEQVQLMNGNRELYDMINNNMMNGDVDPFFLREHCALYDWREAFFNHHFPSGTWFTVDFVNDAFPFDPEDDYLRFITIPYQITRYFDRVMAVASAKVSPGLEWLKQQTYFENNEHLSSEAESKYKSGALTKILLEESDDLDKLAHCEETNVGFSEVAHIIAEVYQTGPKKLEEIALKAILLNYIPWNFLPLSTVPAVIQRKAVHGMYTVEDDAPDNISSEGRDLFEVMRRLFTPENWL